MLPRLGGFLSRRAKSTLLLSALALVVATIVGFGAFGKLKGGGFDDPDSESSRVERELTDRFGGQTNLVLLVHARAGTVESPEVAQAGRELAENVTREKDVSNVVSFWTTGVSDLKSSNGKDALVLAHVSEDDSKRAGELIDKYSVKASADGPVTVTPGGEAAVNDDINSQVIADLAVAEAIAVPVVLILLLFVFGSVVAALLPLIIGTAAIFGTFALLFIMGSLTDVSVFSINLTTALGFGLAIDYALLMVSRFREQLAQGQDVHDAVVHTVRTAGRTIVFSAATVAVALGALLVFPQFFLRSFAYAGIGVVAVAALAALLVMPAVLALLGHRVNAGKLPWSKVDRGSAGPFWGRIAAIVMRRPVLTALPVVVLLVVAASPLLGATFGTPSEQVLPESANSRKAAETLQNGFGQNESTAISVITTGPVDSRQLTEYARHLSELPEVSRVDSSAGVFTDGQLSSPNPAAAAFTRPQAERLSVMTPLSSRSEAAEDLVRGIRDLSGPGNTETLVGGATATLIDAKHSIANRLPLAATLIALTTFVLLFLFTGSIVQPLRALLLNALSLSATIGVMVWMFQDGHLSGIFGFTPQPMEMSMLVLLFCIAFGLSMDYEVFLTSRIKELHDAGLSNAEAVTQGLARTGRIVSTAAALLAVSFFAFGTSSVSFLQMFGLGSGLAILIDATLVRGVLVPVFMRAVGDRSWYAPPVLRRVHRRLALSES